jgi:hypothetical protein
MEAGRTFAVASDDALVGLIAKARNRLVVIAPALTKSVADALACRFDDLGRLDVTVILDSDTGMAGFDRSNNTFAQIVGIRLSHS